MDGMYDGASKAPVQLNEGLEGVAFLPISSIDISGNVKLSIEACIHHAKRKHMLVGDKCWLKVIPSLHVSCAAVALIVRLVVPMSLCINEYFANSLQYGYSSMLLYSSTLSSSPETVVWAVGGIGNGKVGHPGAVDWSCTIVFSRKCNIDIFWYHCCIGKGQRKNRKKWGNSDTFSKIHWRNQSPLQPWSKCQGKHSIHCHAQFRPRISS